MTSLDDFAAQAVGSEVPKGWEAGVELGTDTGTITSGPVEQPIADWDGILKLWNLDPEHFEVVEPAHFKAWDGFAKEEDEDGTSRAVSRRLFSYKATIKRRNPHQIKPETIAEWRKSLLKAKSKAPRAVKRDKISYVALIADPQLGKERTEEAVGNWRRGLEAHAEKITRLVDDGYDVEWVAAFMGDETENVVNNYCVGADELVLTRDMRWVPAGSLMAGDELYTIEEERAGRSGRRYAPGTVTDCVVKDLPSVRISFSDGTELTCTAEHPVLVRPYREAGANATYRWVRADALMDRRYEVVKLADPWEAEDSFDAGWMSGLFDGEGCLQRSKTREAWRLSVSQLPGPVLERAKSILGDRKFGFSETVCAKTGVVTLALLGGYAELLRALGTFRPVRLLDKVGFPYVRTQRNTTVLAVDEVGVRPIAVMGTSSHTYFANGIASHNTSQPHTIELNLSEQLLLDFDMTMWSLKTLASTGAQRRLVTSVRSNHGEWTRNGDKEPVTANRDNSSTFIRLMAQRTLSEVPGWGDVRWEVATHGPHVCTELSGVKAFFSHFYEQKGKGGSTEIKTRTAIERQIIGRTEELGDCKIFFTAHFHHLYSVEWEGRTQWGCPALEAEKSSGYMLNQYGVWSRPGMLGMIVGNACGSRGWSDANVL